jgi:hypothetical protein
VRRRNGSFPVSRPQGVGNRETAAPLLISNDLPLPNAVCCQSASEKPISQASAQIPLLVVQRQFQPDGAVVDELVDVLYTLLMEVPVAQSEVGPQPPEPTCVSHARE